MGSVIPAAELLGASAEASCLIILLFNVSPAQFLFPSLFIPLVPECILQKTLSNDLRVCFWGAQPKAQSPCFITYSMKHLLLQISTVSFEI